MTCEAARAAMEDQFVGEIAPEQADHLREHLKSCEVCRERYDRLARVDVVLSKGGLSDQRRDALQARILGKTAAVQSLAALPPPVRRGWMTLLAAAAVLVVVSALAIPALRASRDDGFTPRGGGTSWGVRAFCVNEGKVTGEALAGGTLRCPSGSFVQFTYTAPEAAQLSIALDGTDQRFFPAELVKAGIDVSLPTSTPVGEWLTGPQRVTARFTDANGATLAQSSLTVTPR